ncbi:UNVERIFIED_CONTAM: hypothetical protein Slati_4419600 [Sesamum latifolium]|uniref:Uncharacterized protein n=1 Tax=Sesamum latifolium TaxID=2727402 RepID=A0AAW2SQX3_9LAMI
MTTSNNEGDQGSYGGNSSLPAAFGPAILPADAIIGDVDISGPDPAPEANILAPDQTAGPDVLKSLFC